MIRKVIFPNVIFAGAILLISIAILLLQPLWIHQYYFSVAGFIAFLMTASHWLLVKKMEASKEFVGLYIILFTVRFLLVGSIFLVFRITNTPSLTLLVVNFFIVYLSYLVFEIKQLLSNLRANS